MTRSVCHTGASLVWLVRAVLLQIRGSVANTAERAGAAATVALGHTELVTEHTGTARPSGANGWPARHQLSQPPVPSRPVLSRPASSRPVLSRPVPFCLVPSRSVGPGTAQGSRARSIRPVRPVCPVPIPSKSAYAVPCRLASLSPDPSSPHLELDSRGRVKPFNRLSCLFLIFFKINNVDRYAFFMIFEPLKTAVPTLEHRTFCVPHFAIFRERVEPNQL